MTATKTRQSYSHSLSPAFEKTGSTNPLIVTLEYLAAFDEYRVSCRLEPLLLLGNAKNVLRAIPDASIDCVMTSPPYWGKREYD